MHAVTIIIPTWDEAPNIPLLIKRLQVATSGWHCNVLFVDDSPTEETCTAIAETALRYTSHDFTIQAYRREHGAAWGGLAGAVTDGLRQASTPFAVVMDADLQHPPELLPVLLQAVVRGNDLVIASRYRTGGSNQGLGSPLRHAVSRGSTYVAKLLFPRALRGVTDPMTGFFAVRLGAIDAENMRPLGFKILLETLVVHRGLKIAEVALQFAPRAHGTSKASFGKGVTYLQQLLRLRLTRKLLEKQHSLSPTPNP